MADLNIAGSATIVDYLSMPLLTSTAKRPADSVDRKAEVCPTPYLIYEFVQVTDTALLPPAVRTRYQSPGSDSGILEERS